MNSALKEALLHGLYNRQYRANNELNPQLLNNSSDDKIWLAIRKELEKCSGFTWILAFITEDMLVPFKQVMADLQQRGVSGTIYTSTYLDFNSPRMFQELAKIPNLKIRIVEQGSLHIKGYLFKQKNRETVIIGSANFTRSAMLQNKEWAIKVSLGANAALKAQFQQEIEMLESASRPLTLSWLANYRQVWIKPVSQARKVISREIVPNKMQKAALKELNNLVKAGAHRALIVSATGTGKTYLGAFAVRDFKPRHFLYVVHREQIAKKALASFYQVIGGKKSDFGLFTGIHKEQNCKYLFATIQTLAEDKNLQKLAKTHFDYILIDEAHRAAAPSYQKVLQYFAPKFCMGMTATPERMDNLDVFRIFDYHLAYEIRLNDALAADMLVPFHYVGVSDYEIDGTAISDTSRLNQLTADTRVQYILQQMDYYGYCGKQAKGIVFCSRQAEARAIALKFSQSGHPAVALTNRDSQKCRSQAVSMLVSGKIEYIVTVDLFNEGIDIPQLNQIVMLRNTKSSIVFTQQLGRGLRKFPGKSFVTVLDFIGNYKNNYLIPLALHDDHSGLKDKAKQEVQLPHLLGLSTINFSKIAQERILANLAKVKLDGLRQLQHNYNALKDKLGRPPLLHDYLHYDSISPLAFIRQPRLQDYGEFLQRMGTTVDISHYGHQVLSFITKELANGKSIQELVLLKLLFNNRQNTATQNDWVQELTKYHARCDTQVLKAGLNFLQLHFFAVKQGKGIKQDDYGSLPVVEYHAGVYQLSRKLAALLKNSSFKNLANDAITTGIMLNRNYDNSKIFTLYRQYSRKDACHLLGWPLDVSAPMYGYRTQNRQTPIFITYQKAAKRRNAVYDNQLVDGQSLRWYTRSPRHLNSPEVRELLADKNRLYLFVKRSDASGKSFYYLGQADIVRDSIKEEEIGAKKKAVVGMDLLLRQPLSAKMQQILFAE